MSNFTVFHDPLLEVYMTAPKLDWSGPLGRGADSFRFPLLAELVNAHSTGSVLEIGCGSGALRELLKTTDYTGVDPSFDIIKASAGFPDDTWLQQDGETFVPSRTFDVMIFNESLYYMDLRTLPRLSTFVNPGGFVAASVFRKGLFGANAAAWRAVRALGLIAEINLKAGGARWDIGIAKAKL